MQRQEKYLEQLSKKAVTDANEELLAPKHVRAIDPDAFPRMSPGTFPNNLSVLENRLVTYTVCSVFILLFICN